MEWTTTLEQFGSSIGIGELRPDADGSCSLLFDGEHEVAFTHDEEDHSLLMYCEIGSASELGKDALLTLLKASLLGAKTGGAAISLNGPVDQIVLWKRFDDNALNVDSMGVAVNVFLAQVSFWKSRMKELAKDHSVAAGNDDASGIMQNFNMFV